MSLFKKPTTFLLLIILTGCYSTKHFEQKIISPVLHKKAISIQQQEADDIFTLLAYALVYRDWQPDSLPRSSRRGYNIGALLVDKDNNPVFSGLNCINSTENATQHGEVRAITQYIEKKKCFNLEGFTIYTTLEPCIMCAGMITMTSVNRVVYGQHDVEYSKAFERLSVDTRPIGGFPPYPRQVISQAAAIDFVSRLDQAYASYLESGDEKILAKFLTSPAAKTIYQEASATFMQLDVKYDENKKIYQKALQYLNQPNHEHR